MPAYLQGPALMAACAAGRGVIVIVEGETDEKDAWFYRQWFDDRATEVSFFPQNGWEKVVFAVRDLRSQLPMRRVFGVRDRDHAEESVMAAQAVSCPADGVFRTARFTLENHLLDPGIWFKFLKTLHRGSMPALYDSVEAIEGIILAEYQRCVPMAAYNLALRREHEHLGTDGIAALTDPSGSPADPEAELTKMQSAHSSSLDLAKVFRDQVARLQGQPLAVLEQYVTGKVVLRLVKERLKLPSISLEQLIPFLITLDNAPPPDLAALVSRIVDRNGSP